LLFVRRAEKVDQSANSRYQQQKTFRSSRPVLNKIKPLKAS
jgi:hypothetical protein